MLSAKRALWCFLVVSLACVSACNDRSALSSSTPAVAGPASASVAGDTGWLSEPATFPTGWMGRNNCTFPLGAGVWDAHPEGGCWERSGPNGQVRQAYNAVHFNAAAGCGGAADLSGIRICVPDAVGGPSVPTACGMTGPRGCAVCAAPTIVCH